MLKHRSLRSYRFLIYFLIFTFMLSGNSYAGGFVHLLPEVQEVSMPDYLQGMVLDSSGNILTVDTVGNYVIRVNSDDCTKQRVTTTDALNFEFYRGIAVTSSDSIYISFTDNDYIQGINPDGGLGMSFGSEGSDLGQFKDPNGVAIDSEGNIYVADTGNHRIQKFDPSGTFLSAWGTRGSGEGQFESPLGIALDSSDNIYITDAGNNRVQKLSPDGVFQWSIDFIYGAVFLTDITVDSEGSLFVANAGNDYIYKYDNGGDFEAMYRTNYGGITGNVGIYPTGVAVDEDGQLYFQGIKDGYLYKLYLVSDGTGTTMRSIKIRSYKPNELVDPYDIALDAERNIYIADTYNHRIKKFGPEGTFVEAWGSEGSETGQFIRPNSIAVDNAGNIYIADTGNYRIQKFDSNGGFIRAWGSQGYAQGQFRNPIGIAVDQSGSVYVSDSYRSDIQKFTSDGGFLAEWDSVYETERYFPNPQHITVDESGYIYITTYDFAYDKHQIMKLDSEGNFVAGFGTYGTGEGQFSMPYGIEVDNFGNMYISELNNHRIQKLGSTGEFIEMWDEYGEGDGEFAFPRGLALDNDGNIYVADSSNNRIQYYYTVEDAITENMDLISWDIIKGSNNSQDNVKTNLSLPAWESEGVNISWNLPDEQDADWLDICTGYVTRPDYGEPDQDIELNLVGTKAGITLIKTFELCIKAKESGSINPDEAVFDMGNKSDVVSNITWNDATGITDIKDNGVSIGAVNYVVDENILTVKKEFLEVLPIGSLTLTVEFDQGFDTQLTVNIKDTINNITEVEDINVVLGTTKENIGLPSRIEVSLLGGGTTTSDIVWDEGTPSYNANIRGIYTFTGSLANPYIINPEGIKAIVDVKVFRPSNPSNNQTPTASIGEIKATPVLDNTTGQLKLNVNPALLDIAFNNATQGIDGKKNVRIEMPAVDLKNYQVTLPAAALSEAPDQNLAIITDVAQASLPGNMLAGTDLQEAENVAISITNVDKSLLPDHLKSAIGTRPIIQLLLSIDGKQTAWNNPNAPVTVSIPYTPTQEELQNNEHIVVWYIDGTGNIIPVPNGCYNPETGMVTFTASHFSNYAIAYVEKEFSDLDSVSWAKNSIEVMASKGIIDGTGDQIYSPYDTISRADYLLLLIKTLGLDIPFTSNFSDVMKDKDYYNALGIAKELGIAVGSGENRFYPDIPISRQDMMTFSVRALEKSMGIKISLIAEQLDEFLDKEDIAIYAVNSVATLVDEELIVGSKSKMNPKSYAARAETAVFLYRLFKYKFN